MTPTDDDVVARLRASLKATADRTPISAGRSTALAALAEHSPSRSLAPAFSAAAAVATVVAVGVVVANSHPGGHRTVQSGAGGPGAGKGRVCGAVSRFGWRPVDPLRGSTCPGRRAIGRVGVGRVTDPRCFGADRSAARSLGSVLAAVNPAGVTARSAGLIAGAIRRYRLGTTGNRVFAAVGRFADDAAGHAGTPPRHRQNYALRFRVE